MTGPDEKLRSSVIRFVAALRTGGRDKKIEQTLYQEVIAEIRRFKASLAGTDDISKKDASILFHLFEATLSEASHANDPAPIVEGAWEFSEEIRQVLEAK